MSDQADADAVENARQKPRNADDAALFGGVLQAIGLDGALFKQEGL